MSGPTMRQRDLLQAVADFRARHAYGPGFRDLCAALDVVSTNSVACLLRPLRDAGLVTSDERVARSLDLTPAGRRWLVPMPALQSGSEVAEVA